MCLERAINAKYIRNAGFGGPEPPKMASTVTSTTQPDMNKKAQLTQRERATAVHV